jgi:hypothetical protein
MRLIVKPRIQKDKWSLYWKTSMATKTELLDELSIDVEPSTTAAALKAQVASMLQWAPVDQLLRLEGFGVPRLANSRARAACARRRRSRGRVSGRRGAVGAVRGERRASSAQGGEESRALTNGHRSPPQAWSFRTARRWRRLA